MALTNNLLGLASLIGNLSELTPVKQHLLKAGHETLLAVDDLLSFVDKTVTEAVSSEDVQRLVHGGVGYAQKTIQILTDRFPEGEEPPILKKKSQRKNPRGPR